MTVWDALASDDRIGFLSEPEEIESWFQKHSQLATASPKVWADAYLLAFAQTAGITLVTFDRALASRAKESTLLA